MCKWATTNHFSCFWLINVLTILTVHHTQTVTFFIQLFNKLNKPFHFYDLSSETKEDVQLSKSINNVHFYKNVFNRIIFWEHSEVWHLFLDYGFWNFWCQVIWPALFCVPVKFYNALVVIWRVGVGNQLTSLLVFFKLKLHLEWMPTKAFLCLLIRMFEF